MRILIDIGHPHEVHFFKNFILELGSEGHEFVVSARNRGIIHDLLKACDIDFIARRKGSGNLAGKMIHLVKTDIFLYKLARKYKPDIFLGFGSFYTAHVARLIGKPSIIFNDTEHSWIVRKIYVPFCNIIITPESYLKNHKSKHLYFKGFKELTYLNNNYCKDNINVNELLGLGKTEKYIILRFISKSAFHDVFYKGFPTKEKIELVNSLNSFARVFIDAEGKLPDELSKFKLDISPVHIHEVLNKASLFIGEGATMAAESALLGTPAVYNYMRFGYLQELERKGLLKYEKNIEGIVDYSKKVLSNNEIINTHKTRAENLRKECIDLTAYMKWLVLNYPSSIEILKKNPDYQLNFINP